MLIEADTIYQGDCREVMREMPEKSIHCVMFSPPYWSLRDYGKETESEWEDGWIGQFGLEPTPNLYVSHFMMIVKEIKRVLRDDGVLYVNIGDTYGGNQGKNSGWSDRSGFGDSPSTQTNIFPELDKSVTKRKSLCMIPEKVSMGIIELGFYLRNKIIWNKLNAMPHSVRDRLTNRWEYLFFFAKSEKYWYDLDAIREPHKTSTIKRCEYPITAFNGDPDNELGRLGKGVSREAVKGKDVKLNPQGKNPGDVFEISTKPFSEAHFAVYPPELCVKPIKSSCPPKVCSRCGTPYIRDKEVEEKGGNIDARDENDGEYLGRPPSGQEWNPAKVKFKGWKKQCDCNTDETVPGIVLDPFAGAGTTCATAYELNRRYIGIEISEEYAQMARDRIGTVELEEDDGWTGDEKVDIELLHRVHGIGDKTMKKIREESKRITLDKLEDAHGVGEKTIERVKDLLVEISKKDKRWKELDSDE